MCWWITEQNLKQGPEGPGWSWVSVSNYHRRIENPQISSTNSHKCLLIFVFPECRNKFKPHSDDSESSGVSSTTSPVASPFSLTPSSSPSSSSSTSPSPGFKDRQGEPAGSTVLTYVKWLARPGGEDPLIENISLRDFDELLLVYCADVKQTGSTLGCGILCFRDLVGPIWKLKLLSLFSSSVTVQPRAPFWTEGIQKPLPPTRPRAKGNDHRFLRARKSIKTGEQKLQLSFFSLRLQTNFIKTLQHSSHDVKIQKHFKAFIYFIHLFYNIHKQCVKRWHWEILFMFKKCLITCNPLKGKSFHWCISVAPYSPILIS